MLKYASLPYGILQINLDKMKNIKLIKLAFPYNAPSMLFSLPALPKQLFVCGNLRLYLLKYFEL